MSIPYRTQQTIKRLAGTVLILLVVAALVWALWILWLQRFVVYTRQDGAVIDFSLSQSLAAGEAAVAPQEENAIEIYYNEGDNKVEHQEGMLQLKGYFVRGEDLSADPAEAWTQIQALPEETPVMLDVKSIYGTFYYSTVTGRPLSSSADIAGVDGLIKKLNASSHYTIARVPALRDREYGLENTNSGLPTAGAYLWMDEDGCYWLNPARDEIVTYLIDIATELKALGFDEVVFEDFYFPDTSSIVFNGDKTATLETAAKAVVQACAAEDFVVSFVTDGTWTFPAGNTRMYREDVNNPVQILEVTEDLEMEDLNQRLVFITTNMDTRFEEYGVLRPITQAH